MRYIMKYYNILSSTALLCGLGGALLFSASPVQAADFNDNTKIESGVIVLGQDMGGMTVAEARSAIEAQMQKVAGSQLTVTFDDKSLGVRVSDLGLTWNSEDSVTQAVSYAKSGPLISRFKERVDLQYENAEVPVEYEYDEAKIRRFVEENIAVLDTQAENASLTREDGEFYVTAGHNGMVTNVDSTVLAITTLLDTELSDTMTAEAVVELTEPAVTTEMLESIHDRLATYSTDYSSSSSNRKTNIKVASGNLNGQILMPGESLSVSNTIKSRTASNGYKLAPQYANGATEMSYGGGVCQVSTTLYNAVIRAELQVDTRYPHSMVVHYVPYSSDAAIAEGNKDFVFTNNQSTPIYIASYADGETLTFSIYGKETRPDSRKIEFVSRTLSEDYLDAVVEYDDSRYEDYEEVTGSSSPRVKSTLTKVVYENGVEVSRTLMYTDIYEGSRKKIIRGTKSYYTEPETTKAETTKAPKETTKAPKETTKATTEAGGDDEPTEKPSKETKPPKETDEEVYG